MSLLGEGVVRILADSSAFDRSLATLGSTASRSLEGRAERIGTRFGEGIGRAAGKAIRIGLVGVLTTASAVVGATFIKGFKRFADIEDATASLTVLFGDAAKAGQFLGKVLKVVEGTPFSLDQFATAAKNLVAMNVQAEKVPGILTAIGDAAAAAGGGAEQVDAIVDSIGRLATGATITLQPIRELEQKGVPALRILANQAGVSAKVMAKRITAGSVDSQKAIDDLVTGIENGTDGINGHTVALAGTMDHLGETARGALANLGTAVARAGAKVITAFASSRGEGNLLATVLTNIRDAVDVFADHAVTMAERIARSKAFGSVIAFFEKLPERVDDAAKAFESGGFQAAFENIFGKVDFVKLVSKATDGIIDAFDKLPHEKFSRLFTNIVVRSIASLAESAAEITAAVVKAAPAIIKGVAEGIFQAARDNPLNVGTLFLAMGLPGIGPAMTSALSGIFGKLPFGTITKPLISGIGTALQGLGKVTGLNTGVQILGDKLALQLAGLSIRLGPVMTAVGTALGTAMDAAIAVGVAIGLPLLAVAIGVAFGILLHKLIEKFLPGVNRALESFGGMVYTFFVETLPRIFTKTIPRAIATALRFFHELPEKAAKALKEKVGDIVAAGADVIEGLIRGIWSKAKRIARSIKEFVSRYVVSPILHFFHIGSPSRLMFGIGSQVAEGFNLGLLRSLANVDARSQLAQLTGQFSGDITLPKFQAGASSLSAGGGIATRAPIVQNFYSNHTDERVLANELSHRMAREAMR